MAGLARTLFGGGMVVLAVSVFGGSAAVHGQVAAPAAQTPVAPAELAPAAQAPAQLGPGLLPNGGLPQGNANAGDAVASAAGAHPLQPALELAQRGLTSIRTNIQDYSCTVVKRERIDGKLGEVFRECVWRFPKQICPRRWLLLSRCSFIFRFVCWFTEKGLNVCVDDIHVKTMYSCGHVFLEICQERCMWTLLSVCNIFFRNDAMQLLHSNTFDAWKEHIATEEQCHYRTQD